jgi:hypothetical protein
MQAVQICNSSTWLCASRALQVAAVVISLQQPVLCRLQLLLWLDKHCLELVLPVELCKPHWRCCGEADELGIVLCCAQPL